MNCKEQRYTSEGKSMAKNTSWYLDTPTHTAKLRNAKAVHVNKTIKRIYFTFSTSMTVQHSGMAQNKIRYILLDVICTSDVHQDWDAGGNRWSDMKHVEQTKAFFINIRMYWAWQIGHSVLHNVLIRFIHSFTVNASFWSELLIFYILGNRADYLVH